MNLKLFFGFPIHQEFAKALTQADPHLLAQLIRNDQDHYLRQIVHEDQSFLGKWVKSFSTLEELENIENHILSIIKQLVPQANSSGGKQNPLVLLPIPIDIL